MTNQMQLFGPSNFPQVDGLPPAPRLVPHDWPFPGMTPEDSARAALSMSNEFADVYVTTIKRHAGGGVLTDMQIKALLPQDWLDLLGPWASRNLCQRECEKYDIEGKHVIHEGGGFHWEYRVRGPA